MIASCLPFERSFVVAAGLEPIWEWIEKFQFTPYDLSYLHRLKDDEESFISSCFFEMDSKGHL
jgi:nicotinic acid phosphoribosyltransferase